MATIKSYTDLYQSKKLAEILPLESADMWWSRCTITDFGDGVLKVSYAVEPCNISQFRNTKEDIPCWSLAALLGVLPKNLNIGRPSLESNYMGYYWIQYYDEFMKPNNYKTVCFNNPVDACYEMILKLHEQNFI